MVERLAFSKFQLEDEVISAGYAHLWIKKPFIKLLPIGDVHLGSPTNMFSKLKQILENLDDDTYIVLLGDMIDLALRDSLGDVYHATAAPDEQLYTFKELLIKHKDRILGVIDGNHEERLSKRIGVRPVAEWCDFLEIPYSPHVLVLDLAVGTGQGRGSRGRSNYIIVLYHGSTGARTIGGKINGNARILEVIPDADLYLTGHTHQPSVVHLARLTVDKYNKKLRKVSSMLITIPAWLGYEEYAARQAFRPSATGTVLITLDGKDKRISTSISMEL